MDYDKRFQQLAAKTFLVLAIKFAIGNCRWRDILRRDTEQLFARMIFFILLAGKRTMYFWSVFAIIWGKKIKSVAKQQLRRLR